MQLQIVNTHFIGFLKYSPYWL